MSVIRILLRGVYSLIGYETLLPKIKYRSIIFRVFLSSGTSSLDLAYVSRDRCNLDVPKQL